MIEKTENIQENAPKSNYYNSTISKALNEIEIINNQIELFNKKMNNQL